MSKLKFENLDSQYFEDNRITSLACYIKKQKNSIYHWKKKISIGLMVVKKENCISVGKVMLIMKIRVLVYSAMKSITLMNQI